ncbi:MAG: class F sortase [Gordonia paraffinivorans]
MIRRTGLVAASAAMVVGIALSACSAHSSPTERPYPIGDPVAASRPVNPSATVVPRGVVRTIDPGILVIPSIAVNSTVLDLGTTVTPDPFLAGRSVSTFEVPPDLSRVGWWRDGARVGGPGMAVILGHSQVGGRYAVFNRLGELAPGAGIEIEDRTRDVRIEFTVEKVVQGISKSDPAALQNTLSEGNSIADLALVTCSGQFEESVAESAENTVVFARRR